LSRCCYRITSRNNQVNYFPLCERGGINRALHLLQRRLPDIKVNEVQSLTEIETMLARDWSEKWKDQGRLEGKAEGKLEGESPLLRKLLIKRWGTLPDWVEQQLTNANRSQPLRLIRWISFVTANFVVAILP